MKHFSEISLIATVSFIGELLHYLIPLPVPSSIYGLLLMLLLLVTHIVRLDHVKATADWLISLMPVMFVGPTVGLITSYDSYKDILIPIVVISLATTVLTMAVSGLTTQGLIRLQTKEEKEEREKGRGKGGADRFSERDRKDAGGGESGKREAAKGGTNRC